MRAGVIPWALAAALVMAAACSRKVAIEGRPCPCSDGYVCCDQVCVAPPAPARCALDAGADGGGGAPEADGGGGGAGAEAGAPADAPGSTDAGGADGLPLTMPVCRMPPADGCPGGLATCGGASACQVRLTSDPANCGSCGRSCRGHDCRDSECQPSLLVATTELYGYGAFAVNRAGMYWGTKDKRLVGRTFGGVETTLASDEGKVTAVLVDDTFAYIYVDGQHCSPSVCLRRIPLVPGAYPSITLARTQAITRGLVLHDRVLYWYDVHGDIHRLDTGASGPLTPVPFATNQGHNGYGLDTDGEYLYWASRGDTDGVIKRRRLDGGDAGPQTVVAGLGGIAALTVDRRNVYWVEEDTQIVAKAPRDGGGTPVTLANGQERMIAMAVDEWNVYWTGVGPNRSVFRVSHCGGAVTGVSAGTYPGRLIALDGFLYWNDASNGVHRYAP